MRIAVAATAVCLSIVGLVSAQEASAAIKRPTHIPPESLAAALKTLASERGLALAYRSEVVGDLKSPGAVGELTTEEAFTRILAGTALTFRYLDEKTVTIVPVASTQAQVQGQGGATSPDKEGKKDSSSEFRVAQVDQGQTSSPSTVEKQDQQASKKKPVQLEEVIVTGSRIPQMAKEGAHEVKVYTQEKIEQSGQTTVSDFLNTLSDVSIAIREQGFQTSLGATTVRLHGLPIGTTLVLVNGRRLETSGSQARADFFDLNNIPLSAVEQIEVVADGSSAVYGSDAIAGVVNILLKRDFDGLEASARYGSALGLNEWTTSLDWGKRWDRGSLTVIGSYQTRGELAVSQRALTRSNDYRAFGGPDNNVNACNPGNVYSLDGVTPLPGLGGATFAAVPTGFTGKPSIQEFATTAGTLNECLNGFGNDIIPETHRAGFFVQGRYAVSPSAEVFTEVLYSRVRQLQSGGFNGLFGAPGAQNQDFTVDALNPYNPFGTTVGISGLFTSNPVFEILDTDFVRLLVGAKGHLFDTWEWEASARSSEDYSKNPQPSVIADNTAIQNALNSPNPATALNPFVNGPYGSSQLLQSFFSDTYETFTGRGDAIEGFVRGPLLRLPSGPIQLLVGAEYGRDRLSFDAVNDGIDPPNTRSSTRRKSYAAFGEATVPIIGNHDPARVGDILAVRLAGRHDHYDDFGSKNTPQIGVEWRPLEPVLVRGTYSEAFKAPALQQLHSPTLVLHGVGIDPLTGNLVSFRRLIGGNPGLNPETGQSHTFGLVWTSRTVPDLSASITNWSVRETNAIQQPTVAVILANEALFPGRVVRNANGVITEVNTTFVNFGEIEAAGVDYELTWKRETKVGIWTPSLSASQTYRYTTALRPNSPAIDATSKAQDSGNWAPRWKGSVAIGWKRGPYSASFDGRYVGRYQDYDSTQQIGNFWLYDANFRYSAGHVFAASNPLLKETYFEVGGVNLFNSLPQFSHAFFNQLGYDPAQSDIRGRFLYAQLGIKW